MARVKCKDEGHEGESDWVDRADAFLVPRYAGGNYRRAGRMYPTVICVACTSRYVAKIEAGEYQGALKVNRWSKSGLTYQYAQFRRQAGLPERNPMTDRDGTDVFQERADRAAEDAHRDQEVNGRFTHPLKGTQDDSEARPLVTRKPGEFHHHFEGSLASACVFCGGHVGTPCRGPKADEWDVRMQDRRDLKESIFGLIYGFNVPAERRQAAAEAIREFDADTRLMFPDRFREPTAEERATQDRFATLMDDFRTPTVRTTERPAADAYFTRYDPPIPFPEDAPTKGEALTQEEYLEGTERAGLEIAASMPLTDWVHRSLGIELTDAQRAEYEAREEQAKARIHRGPLPEGTQVFPLIQKTEQSAAEALRALRESQGRPFREAHHLTALPGRMDVSEPDLQQGAQEVADRALNPCKERDHRRWHCHYAKGHKGEHAFTDADEMRHMKARIQELEDDAQAAVLTIARILAKPLEWSNVKPENKDYYLAQARQMIVEEAGNG